MKNLNFQAKTGMALSAITCGLMLALSPVSYAKGPASIDVNSHDNVSWKLQDSTDTKLAKKHNKLDIKQRGSELPANDLSVLYRIGNGYDSEARELKVQTTQYVQFNNSFDGELAGNTESVFTFGVDLGHNAVLEQINGDLQADLNYASVNLNGNVSIASEVASSDYVGTYTLFARVKPQKEVLQATEGGTSNGLQPTGAITGPFNPGDANVTDTIGDEFINAIEYGSWVMLTLRFEYRDAQEKLDIGGQFEVDWQGTVSVNGGGSFSNIENAETVNVTVQAYQFGGDAVRIVQALSGEETRCGLNNPQACFNTFATAVNYLRNEYPAQFYDSQGNLDISQFLPVRYLTARYEDSGPLLRSYTETPLDNLSLDSRIALREAYNRWENAQMDARRVDYLLDESGLFFGSAKDAALRVLRDRADANITGLTNFINNCPNQGVSACATQWQNQTFFQSYNRSILDI